MHGHVNRNRWMTKMIMKTFNGNSMNNNDTSESDIVYSSLDLV